MPKIRLGNKTVHLPQNRVVRTGVGVALLFGGLLGFLPILGFWMVPLGFIVLAQDFPAVRRINRRVSVWAKRWWTGVRPAKHRSEPSTTP